MDLSAYFAGFVDGEGCFTVSFSPRSKLLLGWEVRPSFSVSQNADRAEVLLLMQRHFQCGSIRPDRSDKTLKFEVRCLNDLVERIIPFFEANPLLSSKPRDFPKDSPKSTGLRRTSASDLTRLTRLSCAWRWRWTLRDGASLL